MLLTFLVLASALLVAAGPYTELRARTTTDTCGCVSGELVVPAPDTHSPMNVGPISTCFCLSDIPSVISTQSAAIQGEKLAGTSAVTSALTEMLNNSPGHKTCNFPDYSEHWCQPSNPCGFTCKDGYTPYPPSWPTECICGEPFRVCNGVCGLYLGHLCPSAKPWKKRDAVDVGRRAVAVCSGGLVACGVYGWQGLNALEPWECVDTQTDLESCGGCMVPFGLNHAHGVDCTAIPGVMDVACAAGACVVQRCLPGYTLSADRSYCVRTGMLSAESDDVLASEYGLEHIPLKRE